jgi:glycosyl transferase family 2
MVQTRAHEELCTGHVEEGVGMTVALSVVIPCWNAEETLATQLEALAAQRVDVDWEVLLCDNGSVDDSLAVADRYREKVPGLRVIPAAGRRGPAYARNVGAAESTADWLAFVDADDEVAAGWLPAMVAGLRRHDLVAGRFEARRLNSSRVVRTRQLDQDTELQYSPFGPALPHAGGGNLGVSRAVFSEIGGFDEGLNCLEDTDFCWRAQLAGHPLVFWPDAVVHVRLRSSLRGMWAQGKAYGTAAAVLDARYPQATTPASAADTARLPGRRLPSFAERAKAAASFARQPGQLLWRAGWSVGHRTARRDPYLPRPNVSSTSSSKRP